MTVQFPMLVAMGLAGSLHCAGMCGGLAALAPGRLLTYLAGKAATYIGLGVVAGVLGDAVLRAAPFGWGARALAVCAALLLLFAALETVGRTPWSARVPLDPLLSHFAPTPFLLGAANGLLPCPLVYAFAAVAAATASPVWGAAVMLVPAVTSALPLAMCSLLGRRFMRLRMPAAVLMFAMAAVTLYRALSPAATAHHPFH